MVDGGGEDGAGAGGSGVAWTSKDGPEVPPPFVAFTVKKYSVPLVSPLTVQVTVGALTVQAVAPE